jgi:hypothetical protein
MSLEQGAVRGGREEWVTRNACYSRQRLWIGERSVTEGLDRIACLYVRACVWFMCVYVQATSWVKKESEKVGVPKHLKQGAKVRGMHCTRTIRPHTYTVHTYKCMHLIQVCVYVLEPTEHHSTSSLNIIHTTHPP